MAQRRALTRALTHPQVVHLPAHAAVLLWDLIKVLIETRLQRNESGQRREVGLWNRMITSVT